MSTPNDENLMKYTQGHELELASSEGDLGKQKIRHKNRDRNHGDATEK